MMRSGPAFLVALAVAIGVPSTGEAAIIGTLSQLSPVATTYDFGVDFAVLNESPLAGATGAVVAVDVSLGLGNTTTSGCEAADFAGFPVGSIALIQRGTCTFLVKAQNAEAAGAAGVLIFNQGNTVERLVLLDNATLTPNALSIPVLGLTYALGESFALSGAPVTIQMSVESVETPEPASLSLFAMGLVGVAARWRSRRRRA